MTTIVLHCMLGLKLWKFSILPIFVKDIFELSAALDRNRNNGQISRLSMLSVSQVSS